MKKVAKTQRAALLRFLQDWSIEQEGKIAPGEKLVIDYDVRRLDTLGENVEVSIRFHPNGPAETASLEPQKVKGKAQRSAPVAPRAFETKVPSDARQVELWFRTFDPSGSPQEAWDSRFGQNYWFDVAAV